MSEIPWNISNKNYTEEERHQLWGTSTKRLTTYCWMSAIFRTQDREVELTNPDNCVSPVKCHNSNEIKHAESIALRNFEEIFYNFTKIAENNTENSIFDLAFWITNSPCHKCKELIYEEMRKIHYLHPEMNLRVLLFFSSLYCNKLSFETALDQLGEWIVDLIGVKISVIIGPIIVSNIVPKPQNVKESKGERIPERRRRDLYSFELFQELKRIIQPFLNAKKYSLKSSQPLFDQNPIDEKILEEIPPNTLFYFSIFPTDNPRLSELNPVVGLFLCLLIYLFVFRSHCGGVDDAYLYQR